MSIEQHQDFHVARRVLRALAPEYRLLATPGIAAGHFAMDQTRKTLEVAEGTPVNEAVAKLLFLMGHIVLVDHATFAPLYGKGLERYKGKEDELISALAELGEQADVTASRWAHRVFLMFWDISSENAEELLEQCKWSRQEWKKYFTC